MTENDNTSGMHEEQIRLLVSQAVTQWRAMFAELTPEQQQFRGKPFYFAPPTQVEVFRFFNWDLDIAVQLWAFSQFEDRLDAEIICHNIETKHATDQLAAILENQRFDRLLEDTWRFRFFRESLTVREAFAEACAESLRTLNSALSAAIWSDHRYGMGGSGDYPSDKLWFWMFQYDPTLDHIKARVVDWIENAKRPRTRESTEQGQPMTPLKEREYDLLGSYLYPHVWVGERPRPSIQQLLKSGIYGGDPHGGRFLKIIFEYEFNGAKLVSTQDGLLAINTKDERLFLDMFNILVAVFNLMGYPFVTLRENELMYLDFGKHEGDIQIMRFEAGKVRLDPWLHRGFRSRVVSIVDLEHAAKVYQDVAGSELLKRLFLIFAEVGSHLFQREHNQSVLWAWIFIEHWVSLKWEEYLSVQCTGSNLRDALEDIGIARNLRALRKLEIIDSSILDQLDRLRSLRNAIAHRGWTATGQEAAETFEVCKKLLSSLLTEPTGQIMPAG